MAHRDVVQQSTYSCTISSWAPADAGEAWSDQTLLEVIRKKRGHSLHVGRLCVVYISGPSRPYGTRGPTGLAMPCRIYRADGERPDDHDLSYCVRREGISLANAARGSSQDPYIQPGCRVRRGMGDG